MGTALALPGIALALPGTALVLPGTTLALPGTALVLPGTALALHGIAIVLPGTALVLPGTALALPPPPIVKLAVFHHNIQWVHLASANITKLHPALRRASMFGFVCLEVSSEGNQILI